MTYLIMFSALCILSSWICVFDHDTNQYLRASERLKWVSQNACEDGASFYNLDEYSEGRLIFNYTDSNKAVREVLVDSLSVDASLRPQVNSYWTSDISYDVFYFDESNLCTKYTNGYKVEQFQFTFPYVYKDSENKFTTDIKEPTVVVRVKAPDIVLDVNKSKPISLSRTSSCELKERHH